MQRKLNTRFLVILTLVVVGGLTALLVGNRVLSGGTAEKNIKMAEIFARDGRLADAAAEYQKAIGKDPKNAETYVKLGDTYGQLTRTDPFVVEKDKQNWSRALEVDPGYLPAMQRLLGAYLEESQLWRAPAGYGRVKDMSSRILQFDPTDNQARASLNIATLQGWLAGVETATREIAESMTALGLLMEKDPTNVDVPYILSLGKVRQGIDAKRDSRDGEAKLLLAEAEQVMQRAVDSNPQNPTFHLRRAQVLLEISSRYVSDVDTRKKFRALATDALARAQELVKPEEVIYGDVSMMAATLAAQDLQLDKAEKILRDLLARRSDDRGVRIALARLISSNSAKRAEAISLLDAGVTEDNSLMGARLRFRTEMEVQAQVLLAGLRIDSLVVAQSDDEKKDLQDKIDNGIKDIHNRSGETPEYLKLKGRLCQVNNQFVEAIQTYTRAVAMNTQMNRAKDDDLLFQLARVYVAAQQTGEARTILMDLIGRHESFIPGRLLLARVLLAEGRADEATPHLKYLETNAGKVPEVIALLVVAAKKDPAKSKVMLGQLPETNRAESVAKARLAMDADDLGMARRLTASILNTNAGDEEAAQLAIQVALRRSKTDEAKLIADKALAANPGSRLLRLIKAQLDGNADAIASEIDQNLDLIKDEYTREIKKYSVANTRGKDDEALQHLEKAEKIKSDSVEVWDLRFQYHAKRKQWNLLQPYMDKLIAANQDRAGGLIYQFRLAMARQENERALELARQLTIKLPEFFQSWLAQGQALQANRKFDEATEAYLRVLDKQATNLDAYRGLIESYYAQARYDDAGRHLAEARNRMPNDQLLRQMEIDHELRYGQPEKVIGLLETQAAASQNRPETWLALGRAYEKILQRKAAKSDPDVVKWAAKLKSHYSKAFERWPGNTEIAGRLADACLITNSPDDAETVLKGHLATVPDRVEPVLMLAEFYVRTVRPGHAEQTLRDAIVKMPDKREIPQRLAQLLAGMGRVDDAVKVIDAAPASDQLTMQKLEILLQAARYKDAQALIDTVTKQRGEDFNLINASTFISLAQNDLTSAMITVQKSLAVKPSNPMAMHQRAVIRLKQSPPDVDGAIADLKVAIQQLPGSIEFRLAASDAYLMRRDSEAAIRELEVAVGVAPRNRAVWSRLLDLYTQATPPRLEACRALVEQIRAAGAANDPELALQAARIAALKQDGNTAIIEMRRAVQLSNGNPDVVRNYLFMLVDMRQNDAVLTEVDQWSAKLSDNWWLHHVRAMAKARMGGQDEAMAQWEQALTLADQAKDETSIVTVVQGMSHEVGVAKSMPLVTSRAKQDARWLTFAASLYQLQGDSKNAMAAIEQVTGSPGKLSDADQQRAWQVAGAIYLQAKPPVADKAIAAYRKVLEKAPDDLATLNNLACLYVENVTPPDPNKALEFSQRAYDLMRKQGTSEPLVMDTHGWVLTQAGRVKDGIVVLQEVVELHPFLDARYHLAEAYLKGNYADAAVRQLDAANQMIAAADRARTPVDAQLRNRIQQALSRASLLAKQAKDAPQP